MIKSVSLIYLQLYHENLFLEFYSFTDFFFLTENERKASVNVTTPDSFHCILGSPAHSLCRQKHLFSKTGGFAMEVWLALTLFMF